jgi:adenine-specific DNA-methyltransferase
MFILTEDEVNEYDCEQLVIPIISKGNMARNKFEINHDLITQLALDGKKVYLLDLAKSSEVELPDPLKEYLNAIAIIERKGIKVQDSYKCSKRKPWYAVPIVKTGSVVFFKRYDVCPRISTNPNGIHTTDIAYNLQLNEGIEAESLVFCFYNSLTLAQCEFAGRYYAGGVSELTPNEFRSIHIPYRRIDKEDISILKGMFRDYEDLDTIIEFVNSKTLALDLSSNEIIQLDSIRKRLIKRRK